MSLSAVNVAAQEVLPRAEITAGVAQQDFASPPPVFSRTSLGLLGTMDFGLDKRVRVETRIAWYPRRELDLFQTQGGETVEVGAGLRLDFAQFRRLTLSATMLPGLLHFSATHTNITSEQTTPATFVSLQLGGSLTFDVSRRLFFRTNLSVRFHPYPGSRVDSPPVDHGTYVSYVSLVVPAGVAHAARIDWGFGYRMGKPQGAPVIATGTRRLSFGTLLSSSVSASPIASTEEETLRKKSAVAGFVSRQLTEWVDAEGTIQYFPRVLETTPFEGGRLIQASAGLRAGARGSRLGVFAKVEPGFASYSHVLRTADDTGSLRPIFTFSRGTYPTLDWGGVVEVYSWRRVFLRMDLSVVHTFFRELIFVTDGIDIPVAPRTSETSDAIRVAFGIGWRRTAPRSTRGSDVHSGKN